MEEIVQVLFSGPPIRADIDDKRKNIEECTIFTVKEPD